MSACLSSPESSAMDSESISNLAFKELVRKYLMTLACKYVDDDVTFMKHLNKQALLGNEDAIHQLSIMKHFESILTNIQKHISDFALLGYQRIANVCLAIQAQPAIPFPTSHNWNVCALSGVNTNSVFVLAQDNASLYLDEHYLPFATMLWTVTHIATIECNRINNFMTSDTSLNIKQSMELYRKSEQMTGEALVSNYEIAFTAVLDVLKQTRLEIELNVCGDPTHPLRVEGCR